MSKPINRRHFASLLAIGGSAALLPPRIDAFETPPSPIRPAPSDADERYWSEVRDQFLVPRRLAPLNAANLCPSPERVLRSLYENTRSIDEDPSSQNRAKMHRGREETREILARYLRASPEEIIITRNTSEGNNLVSSGLDLGPGDEVLIFADNHPSNRSAWTEKGRRFGFDVRIVNPVSPHRGAEYYLTAFEENITARTP